MRKWTRKQKRTMLNAEGLEAILAKRNWKKEKFALLCGISPTALSNYLVGRSGVREDIRERMLKELPEASWDDLFFWESEFAGANIIAQAS